MAEYPNLTGELSTCLISTELTKCSVKRNTNQVCPLNVLKSTVCQTSLYKSGRIHTELSVWREREKEKTMEGRKHNLLTQS